MNQWSETRRYSIRRRTCEGPREGGGNGGEGRTTQSQPETLYQLEGSRREKARGRGDNLTRSLCKKKGDASPGLLGAPPINTPPPSSVHKDRMRSSRSNIKTVNHKLGFEGARSDEKEKKESDPLGSARHKRCGQETEKIPQAKKKTTAQCARVGIRTTLLSTLRSPRGSHSREKDTLKRKSLRSQRQEAVLGNHLKKGRDQGQIIRTRIKYTSARFSRDNHSGKTERPRGVVEGGLVGGSRYRQSTS